MAALALISGRSEFHISWTKVPKPGLVAEHKRSCNPLFEEGIFLPPLGKALQPQNRRKKEFTINPGSNEEGF